MGVPRPAAFVRRASATLLLGLCLTGCTETPFETDSVVPTLSLNSPASGLLLNTPVLSIQGEASDNIGLSTVFYRLNGGPVRNIPITPGRTTVSFSFEVVLAEGNNQVVVTVRDLAGNSAMATLGAGLDTTPPAAPNTTSRSDDGPLFSDAYLSPALLPAKLSR